MKAVGYGLGLMNGSRSLVLLIALVSAGTDALSKAWVQVVVPASGTSVLNDLIRLDVGYNTGVAFGLFANVGWPLIVLVNGGALLIGIWLLTSRKEGFTPKAVAGSGMILGGAAANFVDRVSDGRVTDFIDFGLGATRWPAFNFADGFIIVGILVLLWNAFHTPTSTRA